MSNNKQFVTCSKLLIIFMIFDFVLCLFKNLKIFLYFCCKNDLNLISKK